MKVFDLLKMFTSVIVYAWLLKKQKNKVSEIRLHTKYVSTILFN